MLLRYVLVKLFAVFWEPMSTLRRPRTSNGMANLRSLGVLEKVGSRSREVRRLTKVDWQGVSSSFSLCNKRSSSWFLNVNETILWNYSAWQKKTGNTFGTIFTSQSYQMIARKSLCPRKFVSSLIFLAAGIVWSRLLLSTLMVWSIECFGMSRPCWPKCLRSTMKMWGEDRFVWVCLGSGWNQWNLSVQKLTWEDPASNSWSYFANNCKFDLFDRIWRCLRSTELFLKCKWKSILKCCKCIQMLRSQQWLTLYFCKERSSRDARLLGGLCSCVSVAWQNAPDTVVQKWATV